MSDRADETAPVVVHADGALTLESGELRIEVTRGGGYRGTLRVAQTAARVRVMGRALAVYDGERLLHLCSRCKPAAELRRLVEALGSHAEVERRTSFATLLQLREESAAYRPAGGAAEEAPAADGGSEESAADRVDGADRADATGREGPLAPPGHEALRRVYASQAELDRDSRRMRAAGWVRQEVAGAGGDDSPLAASGSRGGRLRGLLRATSPEREAGAVVVWVRPLGDD